LEAHESRTSDGRGCHLSNVHQTSSSELPDAQTDQDAADIEDWSRAKGAHLNDSSGNDTQRCRQKDGTSAEKVVDRSGKKGADELSHVDDTG
jgi:hypothetical protein